MPVKNFCDRATCHIMILHILLDYLCGEKMQYQKTSPFSMLGVVDGDQNHNQNQLQTVLTWIRFVEMSM